jgi:hypothetical protein
MTRLRAGQLVRFRTHARYFSLLQTFSADPLHQAAAYIRERGAVSPVINLLEFDGCHSHPSSAEVRYSGAILPEILQESPRRVLGQYLPPYIL